MALLTVSKESVFVEAGNYALTSSVFYRLAGIFGLLACVLHVTRHSTLTQLVQNWAVSRAMKIGPALWNCSLSSLKIVVRARK